MAAVLGYVFVGKSEMIRLFSHVFQLHNRV